MKHNIKLITLAITSVMSSQNFAAPPLAIQEGQEQKINKMNSNAWLEIDVQAFEDNISALQKRLAGKSKICAIMKADAYGNGIDLLMPSVMKMNVPCIGIASNEEARIIRSHGYKGDIVRVRAATLNEIQDGLQYNMQELFGDLSQAQEVSELVKKAGKTMKFHLALNSAGMNRNGIDMSTTKGKQDALNIAKLANLEIVGIMTHFPVEDETEIRQNLETFKQDAEWIIKEAGLKRENITLHSANSYATLTVHESHLDMVRPGGLLYGDSIPEFTEYKKTMTFKSQVANINFYPKGSTVGYDRTFKLERDSMLANLPFGYSDGYRRVFTNKGYVLINGHKVPVVGKVSMNTTMVDVTDFPDILEGDEVVIFGKQGNSEVLQSDIEDINGALLADLYTVWGNSNPKFKKQPSKSKE
ncbi:alanine racemase [Haemophilus haemoglobinophilus]|nr:alanine racemase [Canicola haemoglobinophilus]